MNQRYHVYVEGLARANAIDMIDTETLGDVSFILLSQQRAAIKEVYEVTMSFDVIVRRHRISLSKAWEKIKEGLQ